MWPFVFPPEISYLLESQPTRPHNSLAQNSQERTAYSAEGWAPTGKQELNWSPTQG